jgi:pimeloyl-ACP methyl ester carboxylesterase
MSMNTPKTLSSQRPLWQRLLLRRLKFIGIVIVLLAVVLGGSYLFAPQWLLRANYARQAMSAHLEKQTLQVGDTHWVYYEGGQGPTLVLLHGFAASKEIWLPMAGQLTAHFHVVIPDLPGWGESSRNAGASYDIDAQAARMHAFIGALGMKGVMLVGHSMGGAIAGVVAAEHPEDVNRLSLIDAFGLKSDPNDFSRAALAGTDPFVFDDRAGFERAAALAFLHPPQLPGRIVDVMVERNQQDRAFIESTFNALRQPSQYLAVQNRLGQLTMPVMGLWCTQDKIIDVSALESLRDGLSHSSAISSTMLNGCNHMPMMEKPDSTAQVLQAFALSH